MTKIEFLLHKNLTLLKRLGITLLMMTVTRLIFILFNFNFFVNIFFTDFLAGIWIDMITIGIYFIPFYALSLLPFPFYQDKWYQKLLKTVFHITNSVIIALNLIDIEYYRYTIKRSTADLFSTITEDNNIGQLLGAFFADFWWLLIIFIMLILLSNLLYNKTTDQKKRTTQWPIDFANFILMSFVLLIIGRGGFTYRPADMLTAAQFTIPQNMALVGNTPLSIIKTIGKIPLKEENYFEEDSDKIYTAIYRPANELIIRENVNIMVIILESFGNEWLGKKTKKNFTPFLDSLLDQSLYFSNAFANGKKSIEAVPSIFAGIPNLMNNPYISSIYGTNNIDALPELLKEKGYTSAFFHGATNGSMKFDVFTAHLGFEKYFGRTEFNNEEQCDATWGALDEYFLPWAAKTITEDLEEPFLAGLFTLSSHHPYYVPEKYREKLPEGHHPLAKSIAYADMSLRLFFEEAKKQPWYENTVFVITADHTPAGTSIRYQQRIGMYQIPIAVFDPKKEIKPKVEEEIFNQIDIMPTILDLVNFDKDVYTFGNSYYKNNVPFSINFIENSYLFFEGDYMINFFNKETTGLYNYKADTLAYYDSLTFYPELKLQMENKLKGFIQRYNRDLIRNEMTVKPN